jgi:hypothetical protein
VPALLAEVTQVQEATAAMEAARVAVVLATEASTREAAAVWDSTALRVEEVEGWATLAEREVLQRVLRVEVETTMALASAREDAEGFA